MGEAGYPSIVLLKKGSNDAVFDYVTPGSMMAVDINVVTDANGKDTVYLAAGGKHVRSSLRRFRPAGEALRRQGGGSPRLLMY